jgi:APA family basic amino acid/polyamine antiporter
MTSAGDREVQVLSREDRCDPSGQDKPPGLLRALGPTAAMSIVLGTMIGTGIFLKPSEVATEAGTPILILTAWLVGGILSLLGALCYVELGSSIPEPGGEYAYLGEGIGPRWGFLFGWTHSILARPASVAAIAAGFLRFCTFLSPALEKPMYSLNVPGMTGLHFAIAGTHVATLGTLAAITLVNYRGVQQGGRLQVVLTAVKVISILAIIAAGLAWIVGHSGTVELGSKFSLRGGTFLGFWTAVAATAWAYDGWNDLNLVGSEVQDPERNFFRVIVGGVLFVIVTFLLFNTVCVYVLPLKALSISQNPASEVFSTLVGRRAALWMTVILAVSALGTLNSSILSGARVDYAMARDGLFFRFASRIHPRFHTPGNALLFQCAMALLLALTGTFEELTSLVMFANWMFYGMAVASMMRLRHTRPTLPRPYRTWGYPVTPVLFVIGAFTLSAGLWVARPVRSSLGLVLILVGLIPYRAWQKSASLAAKETDERH